LKLPFWVKSTSGEYPPVTFAAVPTSGPWILLSIRGRYLNFNQWLGSLTRLIDRIVGKFILLIAILGANWNKLSVRP